MEEIRNEKLEKLLDKAEETDWTYHIYKEYDGRTYVELEKYSPAGEDFVMTIDFIEESPIQSFLDELVDYYSDFDVDEHVEMYANCRGENGVPETFRELVEDAEAIEEMIEDLSIVLHEKRYELLG